MKNLLTTLIFLIAFSFTQAQVIGKMFPDMEAETVEDKK